MNDATYWLHVLHNHRSIHKIIHVKWSTKLIDIYGFQYEVHSIGPSSFELNWVSATTLDIVYCFDLISLLGFLNKLFLLSFLAFTARNSLGLKWLKLFSFGLLATNDFSLSFPSHFSFDLRCLSLGSYPQGSLCALTFIADAPCLNFHRLKVLTFIADFTFVNPSPPFIKKRERVPCLSGFYF